MKWKPGRSLREIEAQAIKEALDYHSGNKTAAAAGLGISPRTMRNKIHEHPELADYHQRQPGHLKEFQFVQFISREKRDA